ncbi:toprim domain-containing protein [Thermoanaerobacter sp. A7A]|uniref:toprim domain-containing protein n=1 Tax=Thermoanaerobacter sp. A7A TaxID=1350366 RepID=UPI00235B609E|nr:toprim domain-containing protein [Thermoanaerobacter sp. A7A]
MPRNDNGTWVQISCPISYRTHTDRDDEHPSCGITYSDNQKSVVHCFACGTRDLISLCLILYLDRKIDNSVFRYVIEGELLNGSDTKELKMQDIYEHLDSEIPFVPDFVLQLLLPATKSLLARRYFIKRKINTSFLNGLYVWKNGLVFPIYDMNNNIVALHYRSFIGKTFRFLTPADFGVEHKKWSKSYYWYNIQNIDISKPLILVEGEIDALRLMSLGYYNVIASCGSISKEQIDFLKSLSPSVLYIGFDNDKQGRRYTNQIKNQFKYTPMFLLDWSIVGIKDPGDLKNRDQLEKVFKAKNFLNNYISKVS